MDPGDSQHMMMDSESDKCPVCYNHHDEALTQPRELPCGHTLCSQCGDGALNNGQITCTICHVSHTATAATQFPSSHDMEALKRKSKGIQLASVETAKGKPPPDCPRGISRKLWSQLQQEKNSVSSLITSCEEVLSQLGEYQGQLGDWKTHHLQLQDRLYGLVNQNKTAMELLDQEATSVVEMTVQGEEGKTHLHAILGSLDRVATENEAITTIDKTKQSKIKVEDCIQKTQEVFPDVNTVHISVKVQETIREALEIMTPESGVTAGPVHLGDRASSITEKVGKITGGISLKQLTAEDLRSISVPVKRLVEAGLVLAVQQDQDGHRSARITLQDGQLYLHPLMRQPPSTRARTLQYQDVVGVLDASSSTLAFLDLRWAGSERGRVTIRLTPDTGLARQFALLCTGQRGPNYIGTKLLEVVAHGVSGECVRAGNYRSNDGEGGAPQLPDLWQGKYLESGISGAVLSRWWRPWKPVGSHQSAQFIIITRDLPDGLVWGGVFGEVVSGLDVVREAANHTDVTEVTVTDCGIVLPF